MQYRTVSRGRLSLSVLGFGCAPIGGLYQRIDEEMSNATVAAALEAGITYFDTAPFYGAGLSEHRVGAGLRGRRQDVVISTKVGRLLRPAGSGRAGKIMFADALPFDVSVDYTRDGLLRSFEDSLQRIGTDRIDILYIHDVNWQWLGDAVETHYSEVLRSGFPALAELRAEGLIGAIGVGMNDPAMLARFARDADFDLFMLAGRYTLLDQSSLNELLPLCAARGIAIVAASPFNSGILATGATEGAKFYYTDAPAEIIDRTRRIERVCQAYGVPLPAAALQFGLLHPIVVSVATGMASPDEVSRNVAAMDTVIPPGLWHDLKDQGLLHPEAPIGG